MMALKGNDLLVTTPDGVSHGYVLMPGRQYGEAIVHSKASPNVPLNIGSSTPAQAGGQYDVRDSEGDKAITHLDWTLGAGQKSLDDENASPSMFLDSYCIDISRKGQMKLLREMTETAVENVSGPVFSALGYVWMGTNTGTLKYTATPSAAWGDWTACDGYTPTAPISDFATDGSKLFIALPTGATNSVYVNTAADLNTFAKFGSTGSTVAITHLAYQGGFLFGATAAGAGLIDTTTGVYTQATAPFLNITNTPIGLVSAGNAVYWGVSQGSKTFIYQLAFDPDTKDIVTQQYMETPTGFVATCLVGYLSTIYVGGYWESATSGVGKGAIYVAADGYSAPLVEIGDYPEETAVPSAAENDNRIYAMNAVGKDLYFLTNQAIYRWDIDGGGYSHVAAFSGVGATELISSWQAGSAVSWTGADPGSGLHMPAGYTVTETGTATGTWDYTGDIAKLSVAAPTTTWACMSGVVTPAGGDVFVNATGTVIELVMGTAWSSECLEITLKDGTRETRVLYGADFVGSPWAVLLNWNTSTSKWDWGPRYQLIPSLAYILRLELKGAACTLTVSGTPLSSSLTKPNTATNSLKLDCYAGTVNPGATIFDGTYPAGFGYTDGLVFRSSAVCAIDSITVNNASPSASANVSSSIFKPSIASLKGSLVTPYAASEDNVSMAYTNSLANPTVVTANGHGITGTTQVVNFTGSTSTPSIDGNRVATYINANTFSVPVNCSGAGAGLLRYNASTGISRTTTTPAASGWLKQSPTSFHTGSMKKDFRYISVSHDPLPIGSALTATWWLDGETGSSIGVTTGNETRFYIDAQGYNIYSMLGMTRDTTTTLSPVIHSVNVVWDFVKTRKHSYLLQCMSGAKSGRWNEDPLTAIQFLFTASDARCTFEDVLNGSYAGSIETIQFIQAEPSDAEGNSGIVKLEVREVS